MLQEGTAGSACSAPAAVALSGSSAGAIEVVICFELLSEDFVLMLLLRLSFKDGKEPKTLAVLLLLG